MTQSDLIQSLTAGRSALTYRDAKLAVEVVLETMAAALVRHDRIEIRGFGSFSLSHRQPRVGRNPKSGESVDVPERYAVRFRPGREMQLRVKDALEKL